MALIHLWEDVQVFKPEILASAKDLKESIVLSEGAEPVRGLMKIRGIFQRYDVVNANGRKYGKELWERVLKDPRVLESINSGSMQGLTEHPEDGKTRLDRGVTIIVTKIWDDNKGHIMGEAVIPNTNAGRDVVAIIEAGGSIGVSSRADGEVEMRESYQWVKPETFTLITWDVVSDNSVPGARPIPVRESATSSSGLKENNSSETSSQSIKPIMSKIGEMRKIDLAVSQLVKTGFKKLSLNHRLAVFESLTEYKTKASALINEDKSVVTYGSKVVKMIEDAETELDAPPVEAPVGGGDCELVVKILKELCPECDDLKIKETAEGLCAKNAAGEPLGLNAALDALKASSTDAPPANMPPKEGEASVDVQLESALRVIKALSEQVGVVGSADIEELKKQLTEASNKAAKYDSVKARLDENMNLLRKSADYIESSDAKIADLTKQLGESEATLALAVDALKKAGVTDVSKILGETEKKDDKKEEKKEEVVADKKDEKAEKEKAEKEAADKEKAEKEKADKEKADKEKADKEKADKEKAEKEAADKKKEESMPNATVVTDGKPITESKVEEEHEFTRQVGRLRSGAYNQYNK